MAQNLNLNFRVNDSPETLLKELVLSPLIYVRLAGLLCSIVVFGCISDKVDGEIGGGDVCYYNNSNACSFGVAVGVIGFLFCLIFLVKDVLYVVVDSSNNLMAKRVIIIIDAVANGLWAFMWFVAFVHLADQWRKTSFKDSLSTSEYNCANSGVAFSFFNIFIWAAIVVLNVYFFVRVMRSNQATPGQTGGYASFPEGGEAGGIDDSSGQEDGGAGQKYQPPEY